MFELREITKRFGATTALEDLNVRLERGSVTVLIGPSGCGKSTMLRLLVGLERPDSGSVCFEGEELRPERMLEVRRRIGYLIQRGGLFRHLSARENVALMGRQLGWARERVESRLEELVGIVRLSTEMLERYPHQLSGGQMQRVSLMRALFLDPDALLLDEPLGALDPMVRAELQDELREVFDRLNKTVVFVTHDIGEAAFFADRILLLRDGRLVQDGTMEDLVQRPREDFVTEFLDAQRRHVIPLGDGAA